MDVFVIMGNDFPEAVFLHGAAAEDFCAKKKAENVSGTRQIYWRTYRFALNESGGPNATAS